MLENEWTGDSIGPALAGRKPLHTTYSGAGTAGVGYYPTYRETVNAMALQAEKLTAPGDKGPRDRRCVRQPRTPGGSDESLRDARRRVAPRQPRRRRRSRPSPSESLADTIRRVGATDAAAIVLAIPPFSEAEIPLPTGLACDDLAASLTELGIKPAVIVDTCEPHDGWFKLDVGPNATSPDLQSGALPIATKTPTLGDTKGAPAASGPREIGALLAVIRVINQIGGPAEATPAALDKAMREFTGPVPLGAGSLDCSPTGKVAERVQPGSCVRFVDVHQFVHDRWIDLAPIDLGT